MLKKPPAYRLQLAGQGDSFYSGKNIDLMRIT